MELKTRVDAPAGRQEMIITREFELPVDLLFQAYTDPEIVAQWMSTKVIRLDNRAHGSWKFETSDPSGNVVFSANGAIHSIIENEQIIRTFEMENTGFPVQLEFLHFHALTEESSKLTMHVIYKSVADRDNILKMPFARGISMAHDRLQSILKP